MDTISRLPRYAGQAADAASAYTPGPNGRCTIFPFIVDPKIRMSRQLDTSTKGQLAWTVMGKQFEKVLLETDGRRFRIGNDYLSIEKKDTSKWQKRDKIWIQCGKYSCEKLICESQHHSFLDYVCLGCTQRACKASKDIVDNFKENV